MDSEEILLLLEEADSLYYISKGQGDKMSELQKHLEETRDEETQWQEQIYQSLVNLGQLIFEKESPEPSFAEPIEQSLVLIQEKEARFEELNKAGEKLVELSNLNDAIIQERKSIQEDLLNLHEKIGQEAWRLQKQGAWQDPAYVPVFDKLQKLEGRIQDADNDLFRLRSSVSPKGFFNKVNRVFQEKTKQTIKKTAGGSLEKQYTKAGELLLEFASFDKAFQELIPELYEQYHGVYSQWVEKEEKIHQVEEERKSILEQLAEDERQIPKIMSSLEEEIDKLRNDLDSKYQNLGRHYWENKKVPETWTNDIETLETLFGKAADLDKKAEELQIAISIEKMQSEKEAIEKKKVRKESQLAEIQDSIAEFNKSISAVNKEIKAAEKKIKDLQK